MKRTDAVLNALQREHEEARMLRCLGDSMGVEFHPKSLPLPGGGVMEIDGYSQKANAVCEVFTGASDADGSLSEAEEEMLLLHACKLRYVAQTLGHTVRQIVLFRDRRAAQRFCSSRRVIEAMDGSGVEVCVLTAASA